MKSKVLSSSSANSESQKENLRHFPSSEKEKLRMDVSSSVKSEFALITVISQSLGEGSSRQVTNHLNSSDLKSFGEGSSMQITNHKFNGKNFLLWPQSVILVSEGEGRWAILWEKFHVPKTKIKFMSLTTP